MLLSNVLSICWFSLFLFSFSSFILFFIFFIPLMFCFLLFFHFIMHIFLSFFLSASLSFSIHIIFYSIICFLFFYISRLMKTGYKKPLESSDLFPLNPENQSRNIVPVFEAAWKKEKERAKLKTLQR